MHTFQMKSNQISSKAFNIPHTTCPRCASSASSRPWWRRTAQGSRASARADSATADSRCRAAHGWSGALASVSVSASSRRCSLAIDLKIYATFSSTRFCWLRNTSDKEVRNSECECVGIEFKQNENHPVHLQLYDRAVCWWVFIVD